MTKFLSGIVLITFGSLFINGCSNQSAESRHAVSPDLITNPITASGKADKSDLPVMTFDQTKHDFGIVVQGEKLEWTFKFTNTGGSDLVISNASSSCGCTVPDFSKEPVKPGEQGKVEVVFNSAGLTGSVSKSISLLTNAQPNTVRLEITGEIWVPTKK